MSKRKIISIALAVFAPVVAGVLYFSRAFDEIVWCLRYLTAPAPPVKEAGAPEIPPCAGCNLILISLDTLRADRLGFMGSPLGNSPALDRIAARSIVFTSAFTNAYFTTPAHMTAFTSLYPLRHQVDNGKFRIFSANREKAFSRESVNHEHVLAPKYRTLAEILKDHGYKTYWNGSRRNTYLNPEHGFVRGFDFLRDSPFIRGWPLKKVSRKDFDLESLKPLSAGETGPRFVFLHSWVTHLPYYWREENRRVRSPIPLTPRMLGEFRRSVLQNPNLLLDQVAVWPSQERESSDLIAKCLNFSDLSPCFEKYVDLDTFWHAVGQWQHRRAHLILRDQSDEGRRRAVESLAAAYDGGVRDLDRQVRVLWEELERRGRLNDSVVVFFSDHGEEFFEHGTGNHMTFYEPAIRVPFFIYHPKMKSGLTIDRLVSLVDLLPTVLKILRIPAAEQAQGQVGWEAAGEYVFGSTLGADFVRDVSWKLMRDSYGEEELYYLPLDPGEKKNLTGLRNPWVRAAYRRLQKERENWILQQAMGGL